MAATKPATVCEKDLPAVMTATELATFERVDVRLIRRSLEAGEIAGAFRRGNSWRIARDTYLEAMRRSR